jgi:hypothetical protein
MDPLAGVLSTIQQKWKAAQRPREIEEELAKPEHLIVVRAWRYISRGMEGPLSFNEFLALPIPYINEMIELVREEQHEIKAEIERAKRKQGK